MVGMKAVLLIFLFGLASLYGQEGERFDIRIDQSGENRIGYLKIGREHPIDTSTFLYVKFALEAFKQEGVIFILLDLDTPGGEVFAATQIAQLLLKVESEMGIPVVAFIDNWALSAGAMLAYSCRYIGISNTASMGAAEPVLVDQEGNVAAASEKINSALRSEMINLARAYGRSPLLAEAMVDKDVILVMRGGALVKLQTVAQILETDQIISGEGKLLTLTAEQLLTFGIASFESKSLFEVPFFAAIPHRQVLPYEDWRIGFFAFLSHPAIASLLFMGLLLGVYMEITHPGFGIPGALAIGCLALMLVSGFAVQAIHWVEIIFLVLGVVFLALELFVIPGFGIIGVLGILMTVGGLFALTLPSFQGMDLSFSEWSAAWDVLLSRLAWLSGALIVSIALIGYLMRTLPKRRFILKRMVLESDQEGYVSGEVDRSLIGKRGVAYTDLKLSGYVEIEGIPFQAVSQSGYLSKGCCVTIVGSEGAHFIVKETHEIRRD